MIQFNRTVMVMNNNSEEDNAQRRRQRRGCEVVDRKVVRKEVGERGGGSGTGEEE